MIKRVTKTIDLVPHDSTSHEHFTPGALEIVDVDTRDFEPSLSIIISYIETDRDENGSQQYKQYYLEPSGFTTARTSMEATLGDQNNIYISDYVTCVIYKHGATSSDK